MKMLKKVIIVVSLMIATTLFTGCSIGETWDLLWGHNDKDAPVAPASTYDPNAVKVDESVSAPRFTQDLEGSRSYAVNDKAEELRVEAAEEAEGVVTYQWYVNTVDSNGGGEPIVGATTNIYTPDTSKEGRLYYFVVATHEIDKKINLSTSAIAEVFVDPEQEPAPEEVEAGEEEAKKGWVETEKGWRYYDDNGELVKSKTMEVDGKKYRFTKKGYMLTGWYEGKKGWYFFGDDGAMVTSTFIEDGGKNYHLAKNGIMSASKWLEGSGSNTWYYATEDGSLAVGWIEIEGDWYSFTSEGVMRYDEGFDGKWLNPDGKLAH